MCAVSMVMDSFRDRWDHGIPMPGAPYAPYAPGIGGAGGYPPPAVTKADFDAFREKILAELQIMKDLIKSAMKYDADTNQPDCESEEKIAALKTILKSFKIDETIIDQILAENQ